MALFNVTSGPFVSGLTYEHRVSNVNMTVDTTGNNQLRISEENITEGQWLGNDI